MVNIQKKLTPYNYTPMNNRQILYIVIHYVGAVSKAKNNVDYLARERLNASAHYFVDEKEIWQSVDDKNRSWHCGGGLQGKNGHTFHSICTNSNSIGIEMCCKKTQSGEWYFEEETVNNTVDLVKMLMHKHHIPIERVIRHFDVTGKNCPAPYIDEKEWKQFKDKILANKGDLSMTQYEELKKEIEVLKSENEALKDIIGSVYKTVDEIPDYYKSTIKPLIDKGAIKGTGENNLNLPEIIARTLVIINRDKSK
jgi:N-acetylmuramoyl-L-alanine amidase CwlA